MSKIFVSSVDSNLSAAIQKRLPSVNIIHIERKESEELSESDRNNINENAEILVADSPVLIDVLYTAKKLKWAACTWAGMENLLKRIDPNNPPGCILTRMGGAFNKIMGEYVLGYIIAKERYMLQMAKDQELTNWNKSAYMKYRTLDELTVSILGVGEIGQAVASLLSTVGMKVIGVTRTPPSPDRSCPAISQYRTNSELPEVLSLSDYVVSILPSTPETRGLLSGDMFSHCKTKKSVFINIGRGDVTDEQSLVNAFSSGWLGGAVLDVFPVEPLPKDSPLWKIPGVVITPHIAGVSLTNQVASCFVENYQLFIENKPVKFQVDFKAGY